MFQLVRRNTEEDKTVHWKITSLWGGKKVELRETQRAVTPFGGLVVFFEFLRRIGYSEAVRQHLPFSLRSPNAIDPVENFHGVFTLGRCWSAALRTHQFATRRQGLARAAANLAFSHRRHGSQPVQALRARAVPAIFLWLVELAVRTTAGMLLGDSTVFERYGQ
jgi:hypothetical protein